MSAYDLLSSDERNAIAWVRDHGGIDYVKREWRSRVPYDRYVRRRQSLLGHIAECETALGRRREIISKLTHRVSDLTNENAELRKRLMPEGMEWPRFEDGEPVRIGDEFMGNDGKIYTVKQVRFMGCYFSLYDFCDEKPQLKADYGECVKRPAPKALDADGVEIRVGDTVWDVEYGCEHVVTKVSKGTVFVAFEDESADRYDPASLTHTKPEIDSWQRIEEDVMADAKDYCESRGISSEYPKHSGKAKCEDLVRRCRALAERERGE